jgi:hypothetical protein
LACREFSLTVASSVSGIYGGWSHKERMLERRDRRRQIVLEPAVADDDSERIDLLDQSGVSTGSPDPDAANRAARSSRRRNYDRENERRRQLRAAARTQRNSAEVDTAVVQGNESGPGHVVSRWPEPLAALIGAGAVVEEVRLRIDGVSWSLVRSDACQAS